MRRVPATCLAVLALVGQAQAQTVKTVILEFGLVGVWAEACGRPASLANVYATFGLRDAEVVRIEDFGSGRPKETWNVSSAKKLNAETIELQMNVGPVSRSLTLRKVGDKLETVTAAGIDSKSVANDRRLPATKGAPLMSRCS
jgi:hypothetical protein